ncbi:MAG: glycosyltransferase family 39 protein [Anaerolineae bacterium]|nr:glycosyltransferase family 39 protein [Anaerolineae bacterium]
MNNHFAPDHDDLLWQQLKTLPAFRALLRSVEARFYRAIEIPEPILDLGCGDGDFTGVAFKEPITAGIDPWWNPLQKSRQGGHYRLLAQAMGDKMPFPDESFAAVISNSVLEHIPDIQPVLHEANRVLQPGGRLIITMPSDNFTRLLGGAAFFEQLGLTGLANSYRTFFNRISRHAHTDPAEVWAERLAQAGFAVVRWQQYFSQEALWALEWGHVQGMPSAFLHALTGHWIVAPFARSLQVTERWVRPHYEEPFPQEGAYIFIVAQKISSEPIPVHLPEEQRFTLAELTERSVSSEQLAVSSEQLAVSSEPVVVGSEPSPVSNLPIAQSLNLQSPLITLGFLVLALLSALVGQGVMSRSPETAGAGLFWWGLSLVSLAVLLWRQRGGVLSAASWPRLGEIDGRRWLYLAAVALALFAQGQANSQGAQNPGLALLLWGAAAALAVYALWENSAELAGTRTAKLETRNLLLIGLVLFALLFRAINLTGHPFILSGTEANIGLDALRVAEGSLRSPFATGWVSNPTLPAFLMALPIKLLGPSLLAVRLWSPLVGALTVLAVALLGRRLYGDRVGLVAAALLTGWHLHLHYSRLGVTNIWDPLLTLLALGLLALAWQENRHVFWLGAGGALGLCAYFYTSSHLVPLMVAGLVLLWLVANRAELAGRGKGVLAAAALALVIALPQYLYYRATPDVFMERANQYGIWQSGWLLREAAATGQNPVTLLTQQVWRGLIAFNAGSDTSNLYGVPLPLVRSLWAALYLLGIGLALFNWRQVKYQVLLVWLGVTVLFAAAFMDNPPASHRLLIAAPAVVFLTALALVWVGEFVENQLAGFRSEVSSSMSEDAAADSPIPHSSTLLVSNLKPLISNLSLILIILTLALTLSDTLYYFTGYRQANRFGDRNTEAAYAVATYLNQVEGEPMVYFFGPPSMYTGFPTFPFLLRQVRPGINFVDMEVGEAVPDTTGQRIFIYLPERFPEHSQVVSRFPGGNLQSFTGTFADPLFFAYEIAP